MVGRAAAALTALTSIAAAALSPAGVMLAVALVMALLMLTVVAFGLVVLLAIVLLVPGKDEPIDRLLGIIDAIRRGARRRTRSGSNHTKTSLPAKPDPGYAKGPPTMPRERIQSAPQPSRGGSAGVAGDTARHHR